MRRFSVILCYDKGILRARCTVENALFTVAADSDAYATAIAQEAFVLSWWS